MGRESEPRDSGIYREVDEDRSGLCRGCRLQSISELNGLKHDPKIVKDCLFRLHLKDRGEYEDRALKSRIS
jgi:hypothetical protein